MNIIIDKYTSLELENYKGVYSLKEGREKDGVFYPSFCLRKFGKDTPEKNAPVTVRIGDKAKVIEVALFLLKEMTGKDYAPVETPF
jgi:hypothetical protein